MEATHLGGMDCIRIWDTVAPARDPRALAWYHCFPLWAVCGQSRDRSLYAFPVARRTPAPVRAAAGPGGRPRHKLPVESNDSGHKRFLRIIISINSCCTAE